MDAVSLMNVFAAGLVPLFVGYAWYHPKIFGAHWVRLMRITPEMAERGQVKRLRYSLYSICAGVATAFVMSLVASAWDIESIPHSIGLAFLLWLGFMVPTSLGDVLWELKPSALYFIDASYWLISFIAMALILSL